MFRKLSDTPLKLDQSLIGLKEEHSAFIFNKGFLLESRYGLAALLMKVPF
jgi:hypothetical protein